MPRPLNLTQEQRDKANREAREVLDRVLRGESKFDEGPKPKRKPAVRKSDGPKRGTNLKRYDHDEMVKLHTEEGLTSAQIGQKMGAHPKTVANALKNRGVWNADIEGKSGRPKSDFCERGHDQALHRRESPAGSGNWHCHLCKVRRNKEYRQAEARRLRDNRLEVAEQGGEGKGYLYEVWIEGENLGTVLMPIAIARELDLKLRALSSAHLKKGQRSDD